MTINNQTRSKDDSQSVTVRAVEKLRLDILQRTDGEFLGSEDDLIERVEVSRPTFRQVAKILEQENLLTIRRGVGGGYFAKLPTSKAVSHMAAIFLYSRQPKMADLIIAARPLLVQSAELAAKGADAASRSRIEAFLEKNREPIDPTHMSSFFRSEREFGQLLTEASGNAFLELFVLVLYDFSASFIAEAMFHGHPERMATMSQLRGRLLQAILDRDGEIAKIMAYRRTDAIFAWLSEDERQKPAMAVGIGAMT